MLAVRTLSKNSTARVAFRQGRAGHLVQTLFVSISSAGSCAVRSLQPLCVFRNTVTAVTAVPNSCPSACQIHPCMHNKVWIACLLHIRYLMCIRSTHACTTRSGLLAVSAFGDSYPSVYQIHPGMHNEVGDACLLRGFEVLIRDVHDVIQVGQAQHAHIALRRNRIHQVQIACRDLPQEIHLQHTYAFCECSRFADQMMCRELPREVHPRNIWAFCKCSRCPDQMMRSSSDEVHGVTSRKFDVLQRSARSLLACETYHPKLHKGKINDSGNFLIAAEQKSALQPGWRHHASRLAERCPQH